MTEEEAKTILNAFSGISSKRQKHPKLVKAIRVCLNKLEQQEYIDDWIKDKNTEINKLNNVIDRYKEECQSFRSFCRRIRRDDKHNVDDFNYGREHSYIQFLNLIDGEENWSYEGKHFERADKELEEIKEYFMKERGT